MGLLLNFPKKVAIKAIAALVLRPINDYIVRFPKLRRGNLSLYPFYAAAFKENSSAVLARIASEATECSWA